MSNFGNYAVLRFLPYPETGEFVNLGIVMLCSNGDFEYKIETKYSARITAFFKEMPRSVLSVSRRAFAEELNRIKEVMESYRGNPRMQLEIFKGLLSPSATLFRFSDTRTIVVKNAQKVVNELFDDYVNHEFAKNKDSELELVKNVGKLLKKIENREYCEIEIKGDGQPVKFPYSWTHNGKLKQIIRPLSFNLNDTSSIFDKGDKWFGRMKRISGINIPSVDTVLIVEAPRKEEIEKIKAYKSVIRDIKSANEKIRVINNSQNEEDIVSNIK